MGYDKVNLKWLADETVFGALYCWLAIALAGYATVLAISLLRRLIAFASPFALLKNGCFEWVPARGFVIVIHGCLLVSEIGFLVGIVAGGLRILGQFSDRQQPDWVGALFWLVVTGLLYALMRFIRIASTRRLISLKTLSPPKVNVKVSSIAPMRIGDIWRIGTERFPNSRSRFYLTGIWFRRFVWICCITLMLLQLVVAAEFDQHESLDEYTSLRTAMEFLRTEYGKVVVEVRSWQVSQAVWVSVAYYNFVALVILIYSNRNYLLLRLPTCVALCSIFAVSTWLGVAGMGPIGEYQRAPIYATTFVLSSLILWRSQQDLKLASRHKIRRNLLRTILTELATTTGDFLSRVQADSSCRLPKLTCEQLSERITRGAHNIEEVDDLVTRFFGRYMRVARVATKRSTTASMRFLTVDRHTELGEYWPTYNSLRDPVVPLWDQDLFPLVPPTGFQDQLDREALGPKWNPIYYCPPTEQKTETYYETEYYTEYNSSTNQSTTCSRQVAKTRTVTVTCSRCGGVGRLEHKRYLVTNWIVTRPTVVDPPMDMPELVERGEEAFYYRLPIIENGKPIPLKPVHVSASPELIDTIDAAAKQMAAKEIEFAEQILRLTQHAKVYRCDFVVGGLHTIKVRFGLFGIRSGWFFGNRPEFHFPKLPIGWANVGTFLFLPPLALFIWMIVASIMLYLLSVSFSAPAPSKLVDAVNWMMQ